MSRWTEVLMVADKVELYGKHHPCTVCISYTCDEDQDIAGSFDFGDKTENAAYLAKFESGELINVCIKAIATLGEFSGDDFLGGCHEVADNLKDGVKETAKSHGMVENAIFMLKKNIEDAGTFIDNLKK